MLIHPVLNEAHSSIFVSPANHFVRRLSIRLSLCPSSLSVRLSQAFSVTLFRAYVFAGDTCIPRNAATIFLLNPLYRIQLAQLQICTQVRGQKGQKSNWGEIFPVFSISDGR